MKKLCSNQFTEVFPLTMTEYQIFCDFDGTLVDIANTPDKIYVNAYIPRLLDDLSKKNNFCLVSGRSLDDLQRYLAISKFNVFGCHGAEYSPKGQGTCATAKMHPLLQAIEAKLGQVLFVYSGIVIEEKPYSLAIHYRNFKGSSEKLKHQLDDIHDCYRNKVKLLSGKKVYEFCLRGVNKGQAVQAYIASEMSNDKKPAKVVNIFIGDDATDEDGFEKVNSLNGISIRVGYLAESAAHYFVEDIYDVHALLEHFSQANSALLFAS